MSEATSGFETFVHTGISCFSVQIGNLRTVHGFGFHHREECLGSLCERKGSRGVWTERTLAVGPVTSPGVVSFKPLTPSLLVSCGERTGVTLLVRCARGGHSKRCSEKMPLLGPSVLPL